VAVELSNLEREMVSSTLFGWVKGAFTGADREGQGAFERAAGGTIFLDEIGDINHEVQIKLRRAVEEKEICPVGSPSPITVDVKVIAATNIDLDSAVERSLFRHDLLQRFGKRITLPPLRERKADIPLLVYFFIDKCDAPIRAVSHGAMRALMKYTWPGNIRELREVIRDLAVRQKEVIFSFDLPEQVRRAPDEARGDGADTMEETEKREIIRILNMTGWNKTRAAEILGYGSKQTLYNKLKKYDIDDPRDVTPDTK
jgi:two-component system response regulator HydG